MNSEADWWGLVDEGSGETAEAREDDLARGLGSPPPHSDNRL